MKRILLPLLALCALVPPSRAQGTLPRPDANIAEFARGVKFTVAGYNGGAEVQKDFPVLVRLSTAITGFDYNDFYNKNAADLGLIDIGFVDAEGNGLSYDVDTWNTNGESLVWVNLPQMTNGTEFAMWYRSSKTGKDLNSDNVWTNYAGVWHFREDYGAETASVSVYDSTTNGLTGTTQYTAGQTGGQQPATVAASACGGKLGRSRRMGNVNHNSNKGMGGVDVLLGANDSAKRTVVNKLTTASFSGSFWIYGEGTFRYPYYVSRKTGDNAGAWGVQSRDNAAATASQIYLWVNGARDDNKGLFKPSAVSKLTWAKFDFVYSKNGNTWTGSLYKDGSKVGNSLTLNGAINNGSSDLYIGGGSGSDLRPFLGLMDEVRLCYAAPSDARVKADFDTVDDAAFLTAGTVVTNQITERPVVNFTVVDIGASHIQFGGTLSSLGASEATECTFYAKVWPTASAEPPTWTAFASNLTVGAFSGLDKGLTPATAYSYALMISNDVEALSYETRDSFTTSGVGVSGTGGDVTRVGDDWIHYFRVALDDEDAVTNVYTFTPPSYANTVRALVVAGGGPGGYRSGGGGGAGGLVYNAALGVTGGNAYTITVGEGGAASDNIKKFGQQGGSSSISNGVTEVVRAIGGGAGGNGDRQNVSTWRKGQDGGSGGGAAANAADPKIGAGTSGQGNNGGTGSAKDGSWFGGGGGGAGGAGDNAVTDGTNVSGAGGGAGLANDITGADVFYAGGGGGGSDEFSAHAGSPGAGGSGIGGTGSRKVSGTAAAATQGADGTGSGGGGGCGDVEALYQGGDGGDGIVIVRYASQGDYTAIGEPIISLQSAVCNDTTFTGDVAFRVAWAGYGHDEVAEVRAVWGYAKSALTHTDVIATDVIGLGTGSFPLKADKRTVYLRLLAVNAAGEAAYSSEMLSFYVNENAQAVEDDDTPILENIALEADAAWVKVSGEVVSAGQASGSPKTCTVRVKYGTAAAALTTVVTANDVAVGDFTIAVNGLSPNTTYYYAVEIEDDAGTVITEDTASFTTLPHPTFASVATAVDATTLSLSGGLSVAGGGVTTVFVAWGDAAPVVGATFDKNSAAPTFASTNTLSAWTESVSWKVVYSNELTNADGTGNGTVRTQEFSGVLNPVDTAAYTWQAVAGEWSGNWTNAAHWASDKAVCRGYPNGAETAAYFINCTTQNPAVVTIDGKYSVGAFVPNAQNAASDITFRGAGRSSSGLTATSPVLWSDARHVCSDTQIKFEEMAVTFNNDWQIMRHAQDAGGPVAYSNILVRFSNVGLNVNNKQLKLCAPYSQLEFTDETTATAGEVTVSGTDSVLLVDDSTVTVNNYLRLGVQCLPNDGEHILFRGAAPKLTAKTCFSPYKITDQPVGVVFEVPVGGYASTPFVFSHASNTFGQPDGDGSTGKVGMYTFAVSPDSPALKVDALIENNVLVQTTAGFYATVLDDSVFTVPERNGTPAGAFNWGVAGEPLAVGAELSTARQLLLDLQGGRATASLTFPSMPANVSVSSVTTNGVAVVAEGGAYTVEPGAEATVTFAAAEGYKLVGDASATITVDDDTAFPSSSIPTAIRIAPLTITVAQSANVNVSVTTNGVAVAGSDGDYTVMAGDTVVVAFTAAAGYVLAGAPASVTMTVLADATVPAPTAMALAEAISINEIMASNPSLDKGGITNGMGIAEMDWVEFRNFSSEDIDITGWYLSDNDKAGKETKATILGRCVVPAGGYEIVWLDKIHTNATDYAANEGFAVLKLSSSGDLIQIADPNVRVVDKIDFKDKPQIKGYSYGPGTVSYGPNAGTATNVYMKTATPRAANVAEGWGDFTPAVAFSEPHGYKTEAFQLTLSCADPNADIYYTLDGSSPTTASTPYTGPIAISRTTVVRAAVPVVGSVLQFDTSATYIFLDDVLAQEQSKNAPETAVGFPDSGTVKSHKMLYGMRQDIVTGADRDRLLRGFTNSIATISLVIDPANLFNSSTGIYVNPAGRGEEWERQTMLEQINPLDPADGFSMPAGLRIRGSNSRTASRPKHALRLFFRSSYGMSSLAHKIFPGEPDKEAGEYDKIDLRCSQNFSWAGETSNADTFIHEVFSRDSQRDMGQFHTRSRYYNLFINGQYWGLYQTQERGDEHFAESYAGGDSLDWDVIKTTTHDNEKYVLEADEGTLDAWSNLWSTVVVNEAGLSADAIYQRVLGNNPDGTPNAAYPELLNPTNLMAYALITHYIVDGDGPVTPQSKHLNNMYALYDRTDGPTSVHGFFHLRHDAEMSFGKRGNVGYTADPTGWGSGDSSTVDSFNKYDAFWNTLEGFSPVKLHWELEKSAAYRRACADQFDKFFLRPGGAMTTEKNIERFAKRMAELDDAIVCEAARWGKGPDGTGGGFSRTTWLNACRDCTNGFLAVRMPYMLSQYRARGWYPSLDTPRVVNGSGVIYAEGGEVPYLEKVYLTGDAEGTTYYTLDGTDPMDAGATVYGGNGFSIPDEGATIRARTLKNGEWSALEEVALEADVPNDQRYGIRIAAILNAAVVDPDDEFIVLTNTLDRAVSLEGLSIWSEKSGKALVKLTEITNAVELAAGGTIKLTQPANWITGQKLKNGGIFVELHDYNGKRIQNAYVDSESWFWTGEYDEKGKKVCVCNKTGRWFVALEFPGDTDGGEVTLESQWTTSPLPPSPSAPTVIHVY